MAKRPVERIDIRKFVELLDDKARLELCKYTFSVLTEKSQHKFILSIPFDAPGADGG